MSAAVTAVPGSKEAISFLAIAYKTLQAPTCSTVAATCTKACDTNPGCLESLVQRDNGIWKERPDSSKSRTLENTSRAPLRCVKKQLYTSLLQLVADNADVNVDPQTYQTLLQTGAPPPS